MRYVVGFLSLILVGQVAADTEQERLANSAEVMQEILNIPDALPQDLLNKAECVAVMDRVNLHLSRTVPAPMEPMMSLIPSDELINNSGGVR